MRALVTGGAGFIGSHLTDYLLANGHQVVILDDLSTGTMDNLDQLANDRPCTLVRGSILDAAAVERSMTGCDAVFHLAAAVGVRTITEHPVESLHTNLRGTEVVLDIALRLRCHVLLASTGEIYGKNTADWLSEDDDRILGSPLKSRWSYAAVKALDEMLAYCYWQQHELPMTIVRLFNIVGPRQTGRYGMVLPRLVGQALADQPITVYGDGTQRRCFCAVADAVPALVDLLEDPRSCGEAFNLGAAEEVSIRELANRVRELTKSTSRIVHLPYEQAYGPGFEDMQRRVPDTTKIRELIGFSPRTSLDEVILSVARHKLGQEVQRAGASRHASPLGAVAQGTLTTDAFRALADPPPKTNRTGGKPS